MKDEGMPRMLQRKNLTPGQMAFYIALAVSGTAALLQLVFMGPGWQAAATFLLLFILTQWLTWFVIQRFIYRKIKLIYKFIFQTKATRREEYYYQHVLPQKSIEEVSEDVEKWAEQKKSEIELLQRNEAYRKEFLQNLSHEFKTPVFAIQGYIETLLDGNALEDPSVNRKFLENASRNIYRLVHLIEDLDEISRLESGEQPLESSDFVVQDLVRELFEALSLKAQAKAVRLTIKKGCDTPLTVRADKKKIRQVLANLIDNAIKYGKEDGTVEISAYVTDEKNILVEVSDDGIGIAEEHLPRVFERFYRTDYGRSRNIGGSGLGLAICKHIIEAHGKSIHVRSKPDVGTTFGFVLDSGSL